ncbi:MAG: SDR family NAD(P)-dependent oxidoreductase [Spirochaetaceae bacterium]|nr:SDR family NAD(P)-dependent oxidoreductase [Spirochaetaceae bacterium]MDT8297534.1 SDR family NAD(P)-dependent oxidoreductase [Spirochaetaceae bacterium]
MHSINDDQSASSNISPATFSAAHQKFHAEYGPLAVILGASEGIGLAFAEELARRGFSLILAARRIAPLRDAAEQLAAQYGVLTEILPLDLAEPDPWPKIESVISKRDFGLLIYNAAASPIGEFLDLKLEAARRTVAVNVASPLDVLHGAGNSFRERYRRSGKRGGVILMSSLSGIRGTPYVSTYAATKAWNLVMAEGAGIEARSQGVDIMACIAGATDTPGYRDSVTGKGPGAPVQSPKALASETLNKLGRRYSMIPGWGNRLTAALIYGWTPRRWIFGILRKATGGLRHRDDAQLGHK